MRRLPPCLALSGLLILLPLQALAGQTVELLPVVGAGPESAASTSLIALGCMNALFEGGFIASDSRPRSISPEEWDNTALGVRDAEDGLADYVLSFYVTWKASVAVPGRILPSSLRMRIVRVSTVKVVYEGGLSPPPDEAETFKKYNAILGALGAAMAKTFLGAAGSPDLAHASPSGLDRLGGYL